jgi:O-antigen ligase
MTVRLDPFRLFLVVLTVITISRIHQHYPIVARLRPALLMTAAAAIYAYLNPKKMAAGNLLQTWPARVIAAFGVLACLSVPFGISIGGAGSFILQDYSKTLVFALLIVVAVRNARDLYAFIWAMTISTGILVWMALFVFGLSNKGSQAMRLSNLYTYDANDVGLMVLVGLGFVLLALQTARGWRKLACAAILVGIGATIARTGSRGAFVGALAVGLALLFLLRGVSPAKRVGFVLVATLALVLWAPQGYWDQMRTITSPTADYNWTARDGRKEVFKRGIGYMLDYPIFGIGIGNFHKAECFISDKAKNRLPGTGIRCSAAHNSWLEAGAELGIPGLLLWAGTIFGGMGAMMRLRRRIPRAWLKRGDAEQRFLALAPTYLLVSLVGFAVSSFFVSFAWMDPLYVILACMAGLYVAVDRKVQELATAQASLAPA